jgi:hypothetical protein
MMNTASHEGWYAARGELGDASVSVVPLAIARLTLEQRRGALPEPPALSPWCAGAHLPGFTDSRLAARAAGLLDHGCAEPTVSSNGAAQADTSDAARIAIYGVADTVIGYLTVGRSTPTEAARLLETHGGLGPARDNSVSFRVGSVDLTPHLVYTPPHTMHQLYFENETLVLLVSGIPRGLPRTRDELARQFPESRETGRESGWYEVQTPVKACLWLIAVFSTATDKLESYGYAATCPRPDRPSSGQDQ